MSRAEHHTNGEPEVVTTTPPWPGLLLLAGCLALWLAARLWTEGLGHGVALAGAIGCLVGAFGWRLHLLSRSRGDGRTAERWLLAGYVGVGVAVSVYALASDAGLSLLGLTEHPRAGTLLGLAWALLGVLAGAPTLAMELAYLRMPRLPSIELRRIRAAAGASLSLALTLVTVASLNYVARARDVRVDVSYFKVTQPSEGTRAALRRLDVPLEVVLFYRRDSDVLPRLRGYFDSLAAEVDGRLRIREADVALAPQLSRRHRVRGNGYVLLRLLEEPVSQGAARPSSAPEASDGQEAHSTVFEVGTGLAQARSNLRELDGRFQRAFLELVQAERRVLLTVGHGEKNQLRGQPSPGDRVNVLRGVFARLGIETGDLGPGQGLGTGVPETTSAVLVVGPDEPFLPEEAQVLLDYVRDGGRLLLMLDPEVDVGLGPLLSGLGLRQLPGVVASERSHMRRTHTRLDRGLVFTNRYSSHPTVTTASRFAGETTSVFFLAGALAEAAVADAPGAGGPKVSFPLRSGDDFFRDLNRNYARDPEEPLEVLPLMAAVRVPPVDAGAAGAPDGKPERVREGRVVVIGDGDFMTDKLARNNGNLMVLVDSLGWLVESEHMVADTRSETDVRIEHRKGDDQLWFYGTTLAVPLPLALLGLWVARRRWREVPT